MSISCINYIFPEVPANILNHVERLRKILTLDTDIILKKQIVGKFMLNEKKLSVLISRHGTRNVMELSLSI